MNRHRLAAIVLTVVVVCGVPTAGATTATVDTATTNQPEIRTDDARSVTNVDHPRRFVFHIDKLVVEPSVVVIGNGESTRTVVTDSVSIRDRVVRLSSEDITTIHRIAPLKRILAEVIHSGPSAIRLDVRTIRITNVTLVIDLGAVTDGPATVQEQEMDVEPNESFIVKRLEAPENVTVGETLTIEAVVGNPTDRLRTQPVELRVFANVTEVRQVTLGPGEQKQVQFEFNTSKIAPQPYPYLFQVLTEASGNITYVNVTAETQSARAAP